MSQEAYRAAARRLEDFEGLDQWTALKRVFVVTLNEVELPDELHAVLQEAAKHWSGQPTDLLRLKAEVWAYLDDHWPSGTDTATPEGRRDRALLCVLEPDDGQEAYSMHAEWFAEMVDAG